MLQLRPTQMEALNVAAMRPFEDEMVIHSKEFSPRLCEVIGDDQLRVALHRAIARAQCYKFTNRGPIRLFIEMMFLFGSAFDSDPQYLWAADILVAPGDQMDRAEHLCAKVLEYQEKVSGPKAVNTRNALAGLRRFAEQPTTFSASTFEAGVRQDMNRIFPQKARYVGDAGLTALIHEGRAEAQKYKFPSPRCETLVVVLMFAFGHGCTSDPLYPWIERTLADRRIIDPAARAERLEKKALNWLDHVLARPREGVPT